MASANVEPVEDRAELLLVVHRGDLPVGLLRLLLHAPGEVARRRGHEQARAGLDPGRVEDRREHPCLRAGAAMRLVADREVERRYADPACAAAIRGEDW